MSTYNKIQVGNNVVLSLDGDSLSSPSQLALNVTALSNSGEQITGTGFVMEDEYPVGGSMVNNTLTSFICNDNPTKVRDYAFYKCDSLISVSGLDNITSVGSHAFYDCDGLTDIDVSSATTIGDGAFFYCDNLRSIDVSNATSIGDYAFEGCVNLASVDISSAITIGANAFNGCSSTDFKNVDASSATSIGEKAFDSCRYLSRINVSNATSIGESAFSGCIYLDDIIDLPNIVSIGDYAFEACGFSTIDVSNARTIGAGAFYYCDSLTNIVVKNGVEIPFQVHTIDKSRIATVNNHMYWQKSPGTGFTSIYRDSSTTAIGTLSDSNPTFTDDYGVTFTKSSSETKFTITW